MKARLADCFLTFDVIVKTVVCCDGVFLHHT